jgi:hypothetical protein
MATTAVHAATPLRFPLDDFARTAALVISVMAFALFGSTRTVNRAGATQPLGPGWSPPPLPALGALGFGSVSEPRDCDASSMRDGGECLNSDTAIAFVSPGKPEARGPATLSARSSDRGFAAPPVASPDGSNAALPTPARSLAASDIKATINAHLGRVKFCFAQQPDAAGVATIQFVANPEGGAVTDVRLMQSTIGSADVEQCLLRHVSAFRFPSFEGAAKTITVPFRMNP